MSYELKAQAAGEAALARFYDEGNEDACMCETCIVREVLEAAWPHLMELAREEAASS